MSKLYSPMAVVYDQMINWEQRLDREMPLIREILDDYHRLLDIACSTGRHAINLADTHEIVGIDISEEMIDQAKYNARQVNKSEAVTFYQLDALDLDPEIGTFDAGYILANSLANLASKANIIEFLNTARQLIPDGVLFGQTMHLPDKINYPPLRHSSYHGESVIVQRIMIPVQDVPETHRLHFNLIQSDKNDYLSQSAMPLYGMTPSKFREIIDETEWQIKHMWGSYDKDPVDEEVGKIQVWVLE